MKKIIHIIEAASLGGAVLSALFMVLIVVIISVEIMLRSVFNTSTLIADEYSAYFFVAVVLLGIVHIKEELEADYQTEVDIVHYRKKMNTFLKKRIDIEAVYV